MPPTVLCVAEKPSLAASIAAFLSDGTHRTRRGSGPEVHEFTRRFRGAACDFRVTAVLGHVLTIDFPPRFQSWDVDPRALFAAPVTKLEASPGARVVEHLERESRGCSDLILWLDCDREGENICFEVMDACARSMPRTSSRVHRAKFSAVTKRSVEDAMSRLGAPNRCEALAVDARQELDLKVGVAFTRFQTTYFQGKYPALDASVLSYGPCQTPALGFAVERHDARLRHVPEPYWVVEAEVEVEENRKPDLSAAEPVEEAPESKESFAPSESESESESFAPSESSHGRATRSRATRSLTWTRGRVFDERVAAMYRSSVASAGTARTTRVDVETRTRAPPAGLNTVDMLKAASAGMGMGAHRAMQTAERLYIQGFISYPRTESTAYPPGFDLRGAVAVSRNHPGGLGEIARRVLGEETQRDDKPEGSVGSVGTPPINKRILASSRGTDAGDHPPITPAAPATESEIGGGDAWRLYDFIARRCVASVMGECALETVTATLEAGGETFTATGTTVVDPGWTEAMPWRAARDDPLPEALRRVEGAGDAGAGVAIARCDLVARTTEAPPLLSEAELIGLMERHGIGTDASIPTHIHNVEKRGYARVEKTGGARRVAPTELGVTLVQGYRSIDPELALPAVRSHVETQLDLIARGEASHADVVAHALAQFDAKFQNFVAKIRRMDDLFESKFDPRERDEGTRAFSKCGQCGRYLTLVAARRGAPRLYCAAQETTLRLPSDGDVVQWDGRACDLCGFELLVHRVGDRAFPLCPYCLNHPPLPWPAGGTPTAPLGTSTAPPAAVACPHPPAHPVVARRAVLPCPECPPATRAALALEPGVGSGGAGGKHWRLGCTRCAIVAKLPKALIRRVAVAETSLCAACGARCLEVEYKPEASPLADGETKLVACAACGDLLNAHVTLWRGSQSAGLMRGGRGGGTHPFPPTIYHRLPPSSSNMFRQIYHQ